jgi:hypothetical protein
MRRTLQIACAWTAATLLTLQFTALPASAQCVMCYKAVEGAGTRTIDVIKVGIYILMIPTLFIFGAIALMAYRRRKQEPEEGQVVEVPAVSIPEFPVSPR